MPLSIDTPARLRVGVVGFGAIGRYLVKALLTDVKVQSRLELGWVWNRTASKILEATTEAEGFSVPAAAVANVTELTEEFLSTPSNAVDIIVEVSHPMMYATHGLLFLKYSSLFVGSPTALADAELLQQLKQYAETNPAGHAMYVPSGALWGADDILKMGSRGAITSTTITMTKPCDSMRLDDSTETGRRLNAFQSSGEDGDCLLYEGPVGPLCPVAPNNVNTMACLAIASGLGFERTIGRLVASKKIAAHIIDIDVTGQSLPGREGDPFRVSTRRYNPCDPKAVTASATYGSFLSSLLRTNPPRGPGLHFC